jgi:hypothetical protein
MPYKEKYQIGIFQKLRCAAVALVIIHFLSLHIEYVSSLEQILCAKEHRTLPYKQKEMKVCWLLQARAVLGMYLNINPLAVPAAQYYFSHAPCFLFMPIFPGPRFQVTYVKGTQPVPVRSCITRF